MWMSTRSLATIFFGTAALLAASTAQAQRDFITGEPYRPQTSAAATARANWQQRVLQSGQRPTATEQSSGSASKFRMVSTGGGMAGGAVEADGMVFDEAYEGDGVVYSQEAGVPMGDGSMVAENFGGCSEGCGGCGQCDGGFGCDGSGYPCGPGHDCYGLRYINMRESWWASNMTIMAGVQGFKGPVDQGRNGNFGLHEGLNFGGALGLRDIGYQVGLLGVHSNFSGDRSAGYIRRGDRNQLFFTTGLFRRALYGGFQWGIAVDLVRDNYYENSNLAQLRTETSFVRNDCCEIGYYGAYGLRTDRVIDGNLDPTDMFAIFYRRYLPSGGEGRFWGGFTGSGDGIIGGDLRVPLGCSWAIENQVNYLIPKEGRGADGQQNESWGLTVHVVWYVGRSAECAKASPFRPMFNVADNTLFMLDRLR